MEDKSNLLNLGVCRAVIEGIYIVHLQHPILTLLGHLAFGIGTAPIIDGVFPIAIAGGCSSDESCMRVALLSVDHTFVTLTWVKDDSDLAVISFLDNTRHCGHLCHCQSGKHKCKK